MKVSLREKIAYACGDFGNRIANMFISMFLLIFFTDVLGLRPAVAGTISMLVMIWDAINDPIVGHLIDAGRYKGIKIAAWMKGATIPVGICVALLFYSPNGSMGGKIAWAATIYSIYVLALTIFSSPIGTLNAVMTDDPNERTTLGAFRDWGSNLGGLLVSISATSLILHFGNGEMNETGYFITAAIFGVLVIIFGFICAFTCKERIALPSRERTNFWAGLKSALSHRSSIAALTVILAINCSLMGKSTLTTYYAIYVMGNETAASYILSAMSLAPLGIILLVPLLTKRLGKKTMFLLGGVISILSGLIHLFFGSSLVWAIISSVLSGAALCFTTTVMWGTEADICEYSEYKTGVYCLNLYDSIMVFAMKAAVAIATQVIAWVLEIGGYDGTLETQSAGAISVIETLYWALPVVMGIVIIIAACCYKLTPEMMKSARAALAQRAGTERTPE